MVFKFEGSWGFGVKRPFTKTLRRLCYQPPLFEKYYNLSLLYNLVYPSYPIPVCVTSLAATIMIQHHFGMCAVR